MRVIEINAKEWFDKSAGNSYFSAKINIDGKEVGILPFQYGYGDHYVDMASKWLEENNYIKSESENLTGHNVVLWRYCEENDIILVTNKQEKCLKRELDK